MKKGRVLGIDFGEKRIGLALSDPSQTLARPLLVLENSKDLGDRIKALIEKEEVDHVVVGIPLNMDGNVGPKARQALQFKEWLEKLCGRKVQGWDERLTTVQAEQALRQGGLSAGRRAQKVDKVAAQILLQSYLDSRQNVDASGRPGE